jgi:hypothetical protein
LIAASPVRALPALRRPAQPGPGHQADCARPEPAPATAYSHAIITATLGCLADIDGDGQVTVNDFIRFLVYFNNGNLRACDFSGNGVLDVGDFVGFINAVNTPCP